VTKIDLPWPMTSRVPATQSALELHRDTDGSYKPRPTISFAHCPQSPQNDALKYFWDRPW